MPRRGVSAEEKRKRLMHIIYEGKCVFNLKELEKLGRKAGIVSMAVKEVLQSALLHHVRIGNHVFLHTHFERA